MLSLVIPVFNEAESLEEFHRTLSEVLAEIGDDYEIIFVDDGSTDATPEVLARIHVADSKCGVVEFVRNFGKSAAYTAGFARARGQIVLTLDADLQDDPREIPRMLEMLAAGHDMVVGWKQSRIKNELGKALPSRLYNTLLRVLFGLKLHDCNCGFRAMRSEVAHSLALYGGTYRFIPILAQLQGFRVTEIPVQHHRRRFGKSSYGTLRFWTGLLDLLAVRFITAFRQRPLQFFGTLALPFIVTGVGLEVYVLLMKFAFGSALQTHIAALVTGAMLIVMSVQIMATGLIGEMLAAETRSSTFVVARSLGEAERSELGARDRS